MRRRAFGKIMIFLLTLWILWLGIDSLIRGFSNLNVLAARILYQVAGWGFIVVSIFGFLLVISLMRRDGSLF